MKATSTEEDRNTGVKNCRIYVTNTQPSTTFGADIATMTLLFEGQIPRNEEPDCFLCSKKSR